jgi:hypothetical protein
MTTAGIGSDERDGVLKAVAAYLFLIFPNWIGDAPLPHASIRIVGAILEAIKNSLAFVFRILFHSKGFAVLHTNPASSPLPQSHQPDDFIQELVPLFSI